MKSSKNKWIPDLTFVPPGRKNEVIGYDANKYLKPNELSARWRNQISVQTLANWRSKKKGPEFVHVGSRILYPISSVERYEKKFLK